ncbi:MAG: HAD family hydrolase [Brumimicrobium sp.]
MSWIKDFNQNWTLFLDRDGVINERNFNGYISEIDEFIFLPHVFDALERLQKQFYRIIIVTNQQGVGKGLMTKDDLDKIHAYLLSQFEVKNIQIDGIYCATNLKGDVDDRRKPNPKLALEAKADFPEIDFSKSIMVGDTESDIIFGKNLGMKTVLVKSKEKVTLQPDLLVSNLIEFANELGV